MDGVVLMLFAVGMVFGVNRQIQTALVGKLPVVPQLTFLQQMTE